MTFSRELALKRQPFREFILFNDQNQSNNGIFYYFLINFLVVSVLDRFLEKTETSSKQKL